MATPMYRPVAPILFFCLLMAAAFPMLAAAQSAQQALEESEACALELSQTSRRAEQRYRAFLKFLPDPVFVFNLDNTVGVTDLFSVL